MGACIGIFVQQRIGGGWHVWRGSTQNNDPRPATGSHDHIGVFPARGDALCAAHDDPDRWAVICLDDEDEPKEDDAELLLSLRQAAREVAVQRDLVTAEMVAKGKEGVLWTNGRCAAWQSYEAALQAQHELRAKIGI